MKFIYQEVLKFQHSKVKAFSHQTVWQKIVYSDCLKKSQLNDVRSSFFQYLVLGKHIAQRLNAFSERSSSDRDLRIIYQSQQIWLLMALLTLMFEHQSKVFQYFPRPQYRSFWKSVVIVSFKQLVLLVNQKEDDNQLFQFKAQVGLLDDSNSFELKYLFFLCASYYFDFLYWLFNKHQSCLEKIAPLFWCFTLVSRSFQSSFCDCPDCRLGISSSFQGTCSQTLET